MSDIDLTRREVFPFWHLEKVRFSDTDMIGHVNNVAFAALIESGRVAFTRETALTEMPRDILVVMARIEIDYRAELHYPADVHVGSRLLRIGRASFLVGTSVFKGEVCRASSRTTLVAINRATRKSTPIPDGIRAKMEAYLTAQPDPAIPAP